MAWYFILYHTGLDSSRLSVLRGKEVDELGSLSKEGGEEAAGAQQPPALSGGDEARRFGFDDDQPSVGIEVGRIDLSHAEAAQK